MKKHRPNISIIVPIYNIDKYLSRCIESIINQDYKELEILLIDDGSTDNCPQICDKYAEIDDRIKVYHKVNEGLVVARKFGLSYASGEFISFIDGDDWIEPDMYLQMMNILTETKADFIDSGYFCDREGKCDRSGNHKNSIYELNDYVKHKIYLSFMSLDSYVEIYPSIWSKIFRSELIIKTYKNVPDHMQYGEDVINLIHCISAANKMVQTEKVFYHYNYRDDSMSHKKNISYMRKETALWQYCADLILQKDRFMCQTDIDRFFFIKICNAFLFITDYDFGIIQYYSFPNIDCLIDKKVILYGAGKVGKDYIIQLSKYDKCEIICWVDKKHNQFHYKYHEVINIEEALTKDYDLILVAVEQHKLAMEIKKYLLDKGVQEQKIIWYPPKILY